MKLTQYIPEIKIYPQYSNRILFNILSKDLSGFLKYIDDKYTWKFSGMVSTITYDKTKDIIIIGGDMYISISKDQLQDIIDDSRENNEYLDSWDIDIIDYNGKKFYLL
jgi:hypothetical protein